MRTEIMVVASHKMNVQLRKLRGVMGIGLAWGILWAMIFAVLATVVGVIDPAQMDQGDGPIRVGAILGAVGLVSGVAFGVFLAFAEGGKAIRNLSLGRAAMGGILGSAVYPLLTGRVPELIVTCSLGAAIATTSVAIARKAEPSDSKQPRRLRDVFFACVLTPVRDAVNPSTERST